MPSVQYGDKTIEYTIQEKEHLKSHYITVEKNKGVVLKGKVVSQEKADALVLKKARWILEKLELVRTVKEEDIVTGSRLPYLGRKYYTEVYFNEALDDVQVEFNYSKFKITLPAIIDMQPAIQKAMDAFYRQKAMEKIPPRLKKWSKQLNLPYNELKLMKLEKRWGSCTDTNNIIINTEAIKLPFSLIDYLLVHELCHTKIKNHSKEFWAELSRHMPNWRELDEQMYGMRL